MTRTRNDGSAIDDEPARVRIDRRKAVDRMRYVCPNGHTNWDRTNQHIWCQSCRRAYERGENVDPEHYFIKDAATDEEIPWSAVEIVNPER